MSFLEGIDVSQWQAKTPSLRGLAFAFARATYGTGIDTGYARHFGAFRAAGIVSGAYAFGVHGDGAAQAAAFLEVAHDAGLLALDLETEIGKPRMTDDQARTFIGAVRSVGRKVGLYHSASGFPFLGQDWDWVAKWGQFVPTSHWTFWQYRGAPLDLDRFNGDAAALASLAGTTSGEPMIQLPEGLTSPQVVKIVTATDLLDAPNGERVAAAPANRTYPYLGTAPGYKAVSVRTDKPYPDGKERPTQLFVKADHVVVTAAPSAPVAHTVTVLVDGATKASFTLA